MDIRQALLDNEMILKDFISSSISEEYGENWINHSGLPEHRIEELKKIKSQSELERNPLITEDKLFNYCNYLDLANIIEYHWNSKFKIAFADLRDVKTFLSTLHKFHNPDSANRPLFSFHKHLILGITGTIRNNIAVYRSWDKLGKDGFPQIESVQDNYGNLWTMGSPKKIKTKLSLQIGDLIEFVVLASDPEGGELECKLLSGNWQLSNVFQYIVEPKDIGKEVSFPIAIRSKRKYHAYPIGYDDRVTFEYSIIPV